MNFPREQPGLPLPVCPASRFAPRQTMEPRGQLSLRELFLLTLWVALASLALRLALQPLPRAGIENALLISLVLVLLVSPFATRGAMFEHAARRILWGLTAVLLVALLSFFAYT